MACSVQISISIILNKLLPVFTSCFSNISTYGYFQITLQDEYSPPRIDCKTKLLHPNIDYKEEGYDVCLNLFEEWQADFGVDDVIQGLLFLFYEPNWEDPLTSYQLDNEGQVSYTEIIQKTLLGLTVANEDWTFNYEGDDLEELKAKYGGNVIITNEIPPAPPLPQNITSNNVNNIPPAPPLPQNVTSNNAVNIPPAPPLPQNITSNNAVNIPPAPPLPQNVTSNNAVNIPPAPPLPQNVTSNNADNIPPAPPLPQNVTFNNAVNIPPAPPLPQNIISNNAHNIPPAPPLPQNITPNNANRITPFTLQPPPQIIIHNSVPAPSLTNCLQHGELPIEQLDDETPVLPVHGRGVTGAATQMCDCSHRAEDQYSDDTTTYTIGHRLKPQESMVRSRFVKYLGNILLKINKLVTCTSFYQR